MADDVVVLGVIGDQRAVFTVGAERVGAPGVEEDVVHVAHRAGDGFQDLVGLAVPVVGEVRERPVRGG
ncbi:hypothetical protein [Streptomyces sp. NPDC052127]|uniref:hypothetical protein n=1 Tax=Streptomyces sp. NPDC052127 TaxID=3155679 RepID=UPI003444C033